MEYFRPPSVSLAVPVVSLTEVVAAFSHALDVTEGQPEGHCLRAAWIGRALGAAVGLDAAALGDLVHCILLKDLGCSSNAARIAQVYLADDLGFKRDYKRVGDALPEVLGFVFRRTGAGAGALRRGKAIANILRNGPQIAHEMIATRCERGADIARRLRMPRVVVEGVYSLDEHWDGAGKPARLAGEAIPLFARIALMGQVAEVFAREDGVAAARAEIARRRGSWFDPALVDALLALPEGGEPWASLGSPLLEAKLMASVASERIETVDEDYLDEIAAAFGAVIDAKSPYTSGHSGRVADFADHVAEAIGIAPERRRWLRRGALLHDIGKLGVSNRILDKPGALDEEEWRVMRDHAAHTRRILGRLSLFEELAPIAAAHHERIDGTGYPLGLKGGQIGIETRIITACDFYDALTADRPYRGAMSAERALAIMAESEGSGVDPDCLAALRSLPR
ncbi:HD domain-containing phosphohydrolase [Sphingomonas sp. ASV193]|uniref:HD-GYP domain-containing protein n=1 Tax=Sphingomonas sp. ASV193 TaxID=3144405 RepID=UPI0032E8EC50